MNSLPDTRTSWVVRLANTTDVEAWNEFVEIYLPLVYRMARRKGMQHADAEELGQQVLLAVIDAVHRWNPDPKRGRFRDWVFKIARNHIINVMTRSKPIGVGSGESGVMQLLLQHSNPEAEQSFQIEYRREVFRWAAEHVQQTVSATTWQAFWQTSVEEKSVPQVAVSLNMTVGNVYIARSRVLAKLRAKAHRYIDHQGPSVEEQTQ